MRNRNNKLKLLIVVLILFLCPFFVKLKDTFGIYRTTLPTTVNLSVLDPNQNYIVRVEKMMEQVLIQMNIEHIIKI